MPPIQRKKKKGKKKTFFGAFDLRGNRGGESPDLKSVSQCVNARVRGTPGLSRGMLSGLSTAAGGVEVVRARKAVSAALSVLGVNGGARRSITEGAMSWSSA